MKIKKITNLLVWLIFYAFLLKIKKNLKFHLIFLKKVGKKEGISLKV